MHESHKENKQNRLNLLQYEAVLRSMTDVVIVFNRNYEYVEVLPQKPVYEYIPVEDMIGKTIWEILPQNVADVFKKNIDDVFENNKKAIFEYMLHVRNKQLYYHANISKINNDTAIFVGRNITEIRHKEQELRYTNNKYKMLFNNPGIGYIVLNGNFEIDEYNQYCYDIFRDKFGVEITQNLSIFSDKFRWDKNTEQILKANIGSEHRTFEIKRINDKTNRTLWFSVQASYVETGSNESSCFLSFTDITQRRVIVEKFIKSKANLKAMFESSPQKYLMIDDENKLITFNRKVMKNAEYLFTGSPQKNIDIFSILKPEVATIVRNGIRNTQRLNIFSMECVLEANNLQQWFLFEFLFLKEQNATAISVFNITRQKSKEQQISLQKNELEKKQSQLKESFEKVQQVNEELLSSNEELTVLNDELKQLSDKLLESELRFKGFIENSKDGVIITDNSGHLIVWNTAMEKITGLAYNNVKNRLLWVVMQELYDMGIVQNQCKVFSESSIIKALTEGTLLYESSLCFIKNNNIELSIEVIFFPINTPYGYLLGAIARNISESRKVQVERNSLAAVLDASNNIASLKDTDRRYVAVNKAFLNFFNLTSPKDIVGRRLDEILPKNSDITINSNLFDNEVLKLSHSKVYEFRFEKQFENGIKKYYSAHKSPVFTKGKLTGIASISRDITDIVKAEQQIKRQYYQIEKQKRILEHTNADMFAANNALQENQSQLEAIINNAPFAIAVIEDHGYLLNYNQDFQIFTKKITNKQVFSKINIYSIFLEDEYPWFYEHVKDSLNGKMIVTERTFVTGKNSETYITHSIPVKSENKEIRRVLLIFNDITERKNAEQELRNNEFRLKQLNATKDKFFSIIAHDLKNPFSTVMQMSELLLTILPNGDLAKIERFLKLIFNSANVAYSLLENLLQWSRSQTGRMNWNPQVIDIDILVEDTIDFLQSTASNKNINLITSFKSETECYADINMLTTILRNLISNAIKFSNPNSEIHIRTRNYYFNNSDYVIFEIQDFGIGIEEKNVDKLFRIDESYTTEGTANEQGTGLGLILCKEFVERNGGNIFVSSKPDIGSIFSFTIPQNSSCIYVR